VILDKIMTAHIAKAMLQFHVRCRLQVLQKKTADTTLGKNPDDDSRAMT
jgi:hypothetical protein